MEVEYDPYSEDESPELLGLVNGQAGEPHFVHLCKHGCSAVLYSNQNRVNATVGDFVIVKVKRNPPAIAANHRSKHRVTYLRKVAFPESVKAVKHVSGRGKTVMLTLIVKPHQMTSDALLLVDDQLGFIVDKDRCVPQDCLNQNRLVQVDAMVVISPKDRSSSIFVVTKFIKYVDPKPQEPKNQRLSPTHSGCIVDYKDPFCWVWCHGFETVLRLDPAILTAEVTYGSWISFGAPCFYDDYTSIEQATVIGDKFDARGRNGKDFEMNVLCESFLREGSYLYLAKELNERVFDTQNIIRDASPDFPCPLWVSPRISPSGAVRWEISASNEPEPDLSSVEKTGIIMNGLEFEYFVFCPLYHRDLMLHKEKINIPDATGKWISFVDVKTCPNGRILIQGDVKIIPDVVPTRIRCNVAEILVTCNSLQRRNPPIFYSDEVAGDVLDVNELVENPDTVHLPFSVWAVKQKSCDFQCRWKISSQNETVTSPTHSFSNISRAVPSDIQQSEEIQATMPKARPSDSEIQKAMYRAIHGSGEYSDEDDEDEESQASTVSSAAGELAKLGLREDSPIEDDQKENVPPSAQPNGPSYAGKTGQELVAVLLDMPEWADSLRFQNRELHAALLNFAFNGDAPLPK